MGIGRGLVLAAVAFALAAPASASATATLGVENGAIRYVGDNGSNELSVSGVQNGEQGFYVADGTTLGEGCHHYTPTDTNEAAFSNTLCSLTGVSRIEFVGLDGRDVFTTRNITVTDLPVYADMGPGDDHFEFGSTRTDFVSMGTGNDFYFDGLGNDYADLGPGDDTVPTAPGVSAGDDTIVGGDGDDNIDGNTGNDTIIGGRGDDIFQPNDGDDTLDGGPGNDDIACDPGNDAINAGPGDDRVCGGPGLDTIDAGDGNDSVTSLDGQLDGLVSCGAGADVIWSDPFDPVGLDCEQQGAPQVVVLTTTPALPVAVPCSASCSGSTAVYATPKAATPAAGVIPPKEKPVAVGAALARAKFKLARHAKRTLRLKLTKSSAKRLMKLGKTTVEARTVFTQGGKRYSVRRTFGVRPKT